MALLELCKKLRAAWDALFLSRYITFLEQENSRLRLEIAQLRLAPAINKPHAVTPVTETSTPADKVPFAVNPGGRTWQDMKISMRKQEFEAPQEN